MVPDNFVYSYRKFPSPTASQASSVSPKAADLDFRDKMNGKPVLVREAKTVLTLKSQGFHEKLLCDGVTMNLGDACTYGCSFCYVGAAMHKVVHRLIESYNRQHGTSLKFHDFVIRRSDSLQVLKEQLVRRNLARFKNPEDTRVVYSSTLVDAAGNMELLRETAVACELILEHTHWQIRLLSKSPLLAKLVELVPAKYHHRLIFGFSTGTLDDQIAKAFEKGAPLVSKRLEALHWLQDRGFRTFGMLCPSLPQENYEKFSREICSAIRVEKCEHVWAEVINIRGESFTRTVNGLREAGLVAESDRLTEVCGAGKKDAWEEYARATFAAHAANIPSDKLRFLQYVTAESGDWWAGQRSRGAIILGKVAERLGLTTLEDPKGYHLDAAAQARLAAAAARYHGRTPRPERKPAQPPVSPIKIIDELIQDMVRRRAEHLAFLARRAKR